MLSGNVIRSMKYRGAVPCGSAVVYVDESTVEAASGAADERLCGVYCQYRNEDATDASTGEAIPVTVSGPARVCVGAAVDAGGDAYVGTGGKVTGTKASAGSRYLGRFLEDGAKNEYVEVLVQIGEKEVASA